MRVMVTGGTGFVGAHTVKALADAGHEVCLLVRRPDRIDTNVKPLGVESVDYVLGDMTDPGAVREAVSGCDAAIHGAAVVALERRRAAEVLAANPRGTEVVLQAAADAGLDPIVYVSSVSALFSPGLTELHANLPPTESANAYSRSKALSETVARRFQAAGSPVTITYPGGVVGPAAGTAMGEMAGSIRVMVRSGSIPARHGAVSLIDVRDLAAIHAAALIKGKGPRRFVCGGHFLSMPELAQVYRDVTSRRFPVVPVPAPVLRGLGRGMDALSRFVPLESVFTAEGMTMLTRWCPTDDRLVRDELGVTVRDPRDSIAAGIESLLAAGMVTARQAGSVGGTK
jgi:nucleoside-diphosphate-sugar epimerase